MSKKQVELERGLEEFLEPPPMEGDRGETEEGEGTETQWSGAK